MNRVFLLCALSLLAGSAWADLTLKPGTKPKETAKDIKKAQEERMKDGFTTPEGISREVPFITGQSVMIELEAATASMAPVKFLIREQPKHGVLSEVRPHPNPQKSNKGIITYTHTGDITALADSFSYAARLSEGPTSAPATITLLGRAAAPKVEVLRHPLFRPLQAGGEDLAEILVKNTGSAPFLGEVVWPQPFVGPPKIALLVGEEQTYLIKAKPSSPGAYRLELALQPGNDRSTVRSIMECVQPFSVNPSVVELAFDRATGMRQATVKVLNLSPNPLKLAVDANQRVQVPAELLLEPNATQDVTISMKPEDVASFRGEVWFMREPSKEKLMISAAAEPAQLSLADGKQSQLDFGNIERGKDATLRVMLKNTGGVVASIAPLNAPPFFIATPLAELVVQPNASKEVIFAFKPDMPGKYEKVLTLTSTGGDLTLAAKATMVDPRRPGASSTANPAIGIQNPHTPARMQTPGRQSIGSNGASTSSAPPIPSLPATSAATKVTPATTPAVTSPPSEKSGDGPKMSAKAAALGMVRQFGLGLESLPVFRSQLVDPMQAVRAFDIGADYVVLGWLLPEQNSPASVRVETAQYVFNKELKTVLKTWTEVKGWTTAHAPEGAGAARIEGLASDRQYEFRVLGVDTQGRLSKGSDIVSIQTLTPSFFSQELIIGCVIALLLGLAGWGYYSQRRRLAASPALATGMTRA